MFKNLMFQTRHTRVAGIGNTKGSQRAMNLLFAIRDIQHRTGHDLGATFLSGTVVVNALTELYVMFKYLRPHELRRQSISCFDAWAAIFTKKTADYELNVTGSIKRKERFRTYIKVPELAMFLREITDYRTADMINLDVPQKNVRFLSYAPTIEQEEMIGRLVSFAHGGQWEDLGLDIPEPDNLDKAKMLVATNVARKMALDMRLLGDKFHDDADNKASVCARTVYDYYVRSNANRGTQFIFSDLSTYKPNEWNIYTDIKDKLVRLGIPADEIQFIQCAQTERARKKLFADMNSGRVQQFPKQTNVSFATESGRFFTFNVDYREKPEAFVYEVGEKKPEKKANVILTDNIIPAGERDDVMNRVYNAKRQIYNKGIVRNKIVFSLNNLHIYDNLLLFTFEIENKSRLPYDIDYIRYYIVDRKTAKLTASQEVDQQALFSENYAPRIEGNGKMKYVIAFDKFTIPDDKFFRIEINEKNGGRHVLFDLENGDIVNVSDI